MRIVIFNLLVLCVSLHSFAGHVGCVTIYDRTLCESEAHFSYKSESNQWQLTKEEFKIKLVGFLDQLVPNHSMRMAQVFLWVNDFNSFSALRVQVWSAENSYIIDVPTDFTAAQVDSLSLRGAGFLPYPTDFGYTLGEILVTCTTECKEPHKDMLKSMGFANVKSLLSRVLVVSVPQFNEKKSVETIKTNLNFSQFFNSVELSPVMEGNGFRDLAFTLYL